MHELSIAEALARQVADLRAANGAGPVESVHVRIGCFSGVERDALSTAFGCVCELRGWANVTLVAEDVAAQLRCHDCHTVTETFTAFAACPACGGANTSVSGGQDLVLQRIEFSEA